MRVNAKSVEHFEGGRGIGPHRRLSAWCRLIMAPKRLRHGGKGLFFISVCAAGVLFLLPLVAHPLDLTERDSGRGVSVAVGETISLTLAGNPTTGYTWELAEIDRAVLAPGPAPAFAADSSLTGAGGVFTFRLAALKAGSSAVKLSYRRPWETGVPPLRRVEFTVTVLPPDPRVTTACYRSGDGKMAEARFDLDRNLVTVTLPDGRNVTLPVGMSASGARYTDGRETFWEHQGSGRFFRGEALLFEGALQEGDRADSCMR
jgi:inhibitor of cysteine peptidase